MKPQVTQRSDVTYRPKAVAEFAPHTNCVITAFYCNWCGGSSKEVLWGEQR